MVPHPWCFFIPSGRLCAGRSEGRGEGASGAMGTEGAMIRCVGRCLGLAVWTASSESRMCLVPVHEGQRRVGRSRLLTAPPLSPAGGRRVQSSVCGRRAQGLAGRTRRPGVAVAEGSGSSERRRRRVVAAVAARATCIDGLLTGRGANEALCGNPVGNPSVHIELSGHLWWVGHHTDFTQGQRFFGWQRSWAGRVLS